MLMALIVLLLFFTWMVRHPGVVESIGVGEQANPGVITSLAEGAVADDAEIPESDDVISELYMPRMRHTSSPM